MTLATLQLPIFAKFGHDTWIVGETQILDREKFPFRGHFSPKTQTWRGSNSHLTQSRLQVKGCTAERCCLHHVVVQGPGSFRGWSTFLYDVRLRSYGASKLPNFWILALFPHTKRLKSTFRWPAYTAQGYITEWFRFFHVIVEGP